jgi:flagellar motor switch protein FliG
MTERAAEMLQDEMQYIKDLPEKDIDDAQRKVMTAVRDLESRDEITLEQEIKKDSKESDEKDDEAEID